MTSFTNLFMKCMNMMIMKYDRLTACEVHDARAGEVVVALYPKPPLAVPGPVRDELSAARGSSSVTL